MCSIFAQHPAWLACAGFSFGSKLTRESVSQDSALPIPSFFPGPCMIFLSTCLIFEGETVRLLSPLAPFSNHFNSSGTWRGSNIIPESHKQAISCWLQFILSKTKPYHNDWACGLALLNETITSMMPAAQCYWKAAQSTKDSFLHALSFNLPLGECISYSSGCLTWQDYDISTYSKQQISVTRSIALKTKQTFPTLLIVGLLSVSGRSVTVLFPWQPRHKEEVLPALSYFFKVTSPKIYD